MEYNPHETQYMTNREINDIIIESIGRSVLAGREPRL